jgi:hypothetical protein
MIYFIKSRFWKGKDKNGLLLALLLTVSCCHPSPDLLYTSDHYSVYPDSVVQGSFKAVIRSATEIVSSYQSPLSQTARSRVQFKFSINSRDNEMPPGINHFVTLQPKNGTVVTGPVRFGSPYIDTAGIPVADLPVNTLWTIKLDARDMMKAFTEKGYFRPYNGTSIYRSDFKGLYIAGGTDPLSWDFENLCNNKSFALSDDDGDGIYEVTLVLNPKTEADKPAAWKLTADLTDYPLFQSSQRIADALYNLSLEEMVKDIRPDSTFMAGAKWNGVWTRDISYSIALSLALLEPEIAKNSLLKKVKNKRIIQDTGTGGSWPISTDRTTWALAAWEIYNFTGDRKWLSQAYEIINNSVCDDQMVAFDKTTGLMYGESSFLDWREQSYPKWMGPVDIYESKSLGTNAVHYQTRMILSEMAGILGLSGEEHKAFARQIKTGINKYLWLNDEGYYAQFLYGKNSGTPSPRSEALGEALCVLYGIADSAQEERIVSGTPVTAFGIPCIFPQIRDIQPYHNNAVWPFVEAFWTLASAKAGNETSVVEGLASIYRQAALFLTNKENMVAETGDFKGTAINSDRQLWSVAGNLAMVFKLFFGMDLQPDGILFQPFVPKTCNGERTLTGMHYRNMVIDIKVTGYGRDIRSFSMDGNKSTHPFLPAGLSGHHTIVIEMNNREAEPGRINMKPVDFMPFPGATTKNEPRSAVDSFFHVLSPESASIVEAENAAPLSQRSCKGFSGKGFIEISKERNRQIVFRVKVDKAGDYAIDFRYSNGSGPVNTDNKCAIRTLKKDAEIIGAFVFPQLGKEEWSNWGNSNVLTARLSKGVNLLTLSFEPYDENMNGEINTALLDFMRLTKIR